MGKKKKDDFTVEDQRRLAEYYDELLSEPLKEELEKVPPKKEEEYGKYYNTNYEDDDNENVSFIYGGKKGKKKKKNRRNDKPSINGILKGKNKEDRFTSVLNQAIEDSKDVVNEEVPVSYTKESPIKYGEVDTTHELHVSGFDVDAFIAEAARMENEDGDLKNDEHTSSEYFEDSYPSESIDEDDVDDDLDINDISNMARIYYDKESESYHIFNEHKTVDNIKPDMILSLKYIKRSPFMVDMRGNRDEVLFEDLKMRLQTLMLLLRKPDFVLRKESLLDILQKFSNIDYDLITIFKSSSFVTDDVNYLIYLNSPFENEDGCDELCALYNSFEDIYPKLNGFINDFEMIITNHLVTGYLKYNGDDFDEEESKTTLEDFLVENIEIYEDNDLYTGNGDKPLGEDDLSKMVRFDVAVLKSHVHKFVTDFHKYVEGNEPSVDEDKSSDIITINIEETKDSNESDVDFEDIDDSDKIIIEKQTR